MRPVPRSQDRSLEREQFHELAAFFPALPCGRSSRRSSGASKCFGRSARLWPKAKPPTLKIVVASPSTSCPTLSNPAAEGTKMQPKFFLTSAKLPFGTPDKERRGHGRQVDDAKSMVREGIRQSHLGRARRRGILYADRRSWAGSHPFGSQDN